MATKKTAKKTTKKVTTKKKAEPSSFMDAINTALGTKIDDPINESYQRPGSIPFKHIGLNIISGGIIRGKIAEIVGPSQSGKSFLMYEIMGSAVASGGAARLYDTERAFDAAMGVVAGIPKNNGGRFSLEEQINVIEDMKYDIKKFVIAARAFLKNDEPIVVGIDSFHGCRFAEQVKKNNEGKEAGRDHQKKNDVWYDMLDYLIPFLDDANANLILINPQTIDTNILFGDNTSRRAPQTHFKCSQIFWAKMPMTNKTDREEVGDQTIKTVQRVKWEMRKNRFVPAWKFVELKYHTDKGLLKGSGLGDLLVREKKVRKEEYKEGRSKKFGYIVLDDESEKLYTLEEAKLMLDDWPHLLEPQYLDIKNIQEDDSLEPQDIVDDEVTDEDME